MKKCIMCGQEIRANAIYCPACKKEYKKIYNKDYRKKRMKEVQTQKGICADCGKKLKDQRAKRCPECLLIMKEKLHREFVELHGREPKRSKALCELCGEPIETMSGEICADCRKKESTMLRESRKKEAIKTDMPAKWRKKFKTDYEAEVRWKQKKISEELMKCKAAGKSYGQAVSEGII